MVADRPEKGGAHVVDIMVGFDAVKKLEECLDIIGKYVRRLRADPDKSRS